MTFDEALIESCYKYEVLLSPIEIGFLHGMLNDYIKNEENKDKGIDIAHVINGKMNHIIEQIRSEGR